MDVGESALAMRLQKLGLECDPVTLYREIYAPVAHWIADRHKAAGRPIVIGVNGAQGAGKSTFCALMTPLLQRVHGLRVATLSIDDVYHTRATRHAMSRDIHPLCAIRGVPGTHDVQMACQLIDRLLQQKPGTSVALPRFDKARDDRKPSTEWEPVSEPLDVLLFEGWCVACPTLPPWDGPYNEREAREDAEGVWSRWSADCLRRDYPPLFARIEALIMIQVPSMASVRTSRWLQEKALWQRAEPGTEQAWVGRMTQEQVFDYVALFERYTEHMFSHLPARADVWITRDDAFRHVLQKCPAPVTP